MHDATPFRWADLPVDHPTDLADRRRVVGQKLMISHVTLARGFRVATHRHENEQVALVVEGRMRFRIGEAGHARDLVLGPGEGLLLPGGVPHAAEALETSVVLDVFAPPSERTGIDRVESRAD